MIQMKCMIWFKEDMEERISNLLSGNETINNFCYKGVEERVNRMEARSERARIQMMEKLNTDILFVTKGSEGASLFTKEGNNSIPTETHSVHDVSGAGDTMISTFTLADLCGANAIEAANIANIAASIVCAQVGVVPINVDDLLQLI